MNAITGLAAFAGTSSSTAEILGPEGEGFALLLGGQRACARRAFSCLVEPAPGDLVLVAVAGGERYILAVLERRGDAPLCLPLAEGASITATPGRIDVATGTFALQADAAQVAATKLGVLAGRTDVRLGAVRLVAEAIESMAERVIGRFRRSYRFVEEGEHLRARDIDHRASGHLHLRGDTTAVQAKALVKVQSAQIHLG
ncbi:DUF3540 domain-containing protein [Roseomonas rosulenta]|uniref:DUF3540 domain-containing protein n=1 Tax=Roseomonas rosulenta TaxID=2748667 RepID=UPI0018E026E7|nr:DUF3540 domain-containing protein [Roseomonas rosulenta]